MGRNLFRGALSGHRRHAHTRVPAATAVILMAAWSHALALDVAPAGGARPSAMVRPQNLRPVVGRAPRPNVHGSLPPLERVRLDDAFVLALRAVEEVPECRALFEALGAEPAAELAATTYSDASDWSPTCAHSVAAFTTVGTPATALCPAFQRLETDDASIILIHEALHAAGLPEWPPFPGAMTSEQINRMVRTSCQASPSAHGGSGTQLAGAGVRIHTGNAIQSR